MSYFRNDKWRLVGAVALAAAASTTVFDAQILDAVDQAAESLVFWILDLFDAGHPVDLVAGIVGHSPDFVAAVIWSTF